jgi:hypothetical protein
MNQIVKPPLAGALTSVQDILLAETAIRVQLSQTNYNLAASRGEALSAWIDRKESPLHGRVQLTYAQGSMAINATIARRMRTDEFDIDLIAQIASWLGMTAKQMLDLLYVAIRGEPGSRYYHMVERRNRCVTVHYADGMHLDITPAVICPDRIARTSVIFHHKPEEKGDPTGRMLFANPWGFAEHFKLCTPADTGFAKAFRDRERQWELAQVMKADMEPVPEQKPPHEKSLAVIALQLIKRNRNVNYDKRPQCRPPSVLLAKYVADAANHTTTLYDEVIHQAQHMRQSLWAAHVQGRLIHEVNPRCSEDVFTDRWPANLNDQKLFIDDLDHLVAQLQRMKHPDCDLEEMREILEDLFGETVTGEVIASFVERYAKPIADGRSYQEPKTGRIDLRSSLAAPGIIGASSPSSSVATPRNTFEGSEPPKKS